MNAPAPIALLATAFVLLVALAFPGGAAAIDRTVAVKGEAIQKVVNDTAELGFSVSVERKSKGAALRVVAARLRAVIAAAQAIPGVGPGDVTTGPISVRKLTRDGRVLWRAAEGAGVVLHQPERAGELVSAAVAAGATGTRGPFYFPSHPDTAYDEALLVAFDQAKAKAAALAARAGAVLGPALTIEEGREVVPTERDAKEGPLSSEPAATPPSKPGTSTVTATVRVVFALE